MSKREFRRGYDGVFHGRPMRLSYGKIMVVGGGVVVYRPPLGEERPKRLPRFSSRDVLLLAVCAWPLTLVAMLFVVSVIHIGIGALLHG